MRIRVVRSDKNIIPTMLRPDDSSSSRAWPTATRAPSPGQPPSNHRECASLSLRLTMGGRSDIAWTCHAPWDPATGSFISRRNVWLVGRCASPGGGAARFGLHDIGAQHRTKLLWVRLQCPDADAKLIELTRVAGATPTLPPSWIDQGRAPQSVNGFFAIEPSHPRIAAGGWLDFDHLYELAFTAPWCDLEVFYDQYPVGTIAAQLNDGGPPPIPPISMEN